ncbi:MAG TPA: putative LPS assembly protein LptD, partial [Gemmatimonadaceae bacterium]|nr:putative LPS assembly protein LptD [Gemmatimonadaceae bacterium]
RGAVTNVSTSVESGQTWYLSARRSFFQSDTAARGDTTKAEQRFYARNGTLTSCSDPNPDYYFKAKEIKLVQGRILVARPAILYIEDVPVAWLPFIFQDLRKGRRSGLIPPRVGVSDIVRNNPYYQRRVDDLGYYWAINDYMGAQVSLDWVSGARTRPGGIGGQLTTRGSFEYRWMDRFLAGNLELERLTGAYGRSMNYRWSHNQSFSQNTSFNTSINYATNATATRRSDTNPYGALSSINSNANLSTSLGPARISLGGDRSETLRGTINMTLPTFSLTTPTISLAPWLSWTPSLNARNRLQDRINTGLPIPFTFGASGDSTRRLGTSRVTELTLGSPLTIHNYTISLNFATRDLENNFPSAQKVVSGRDTTTRVYAKTFETGMTFDFGFGLPQLLRGSWNLAPSVNFVNEDGSSYSALRNERTGGAWVTQGKRPQFSLSSTPTFFGLFPGFGPFSRFRHSINPSIQYSFARAGHPSEEFLNAQGRSLTGDLGALRQNSISLGLATNLEAKLKSGTDTLNAEQSSSEKIKLLSLQFDGVGYNFEQYRYLKRQHLSPKWFAGITTSDWGFRVASDLAPNATLGVRYSLFEGDVRSDTARFKPFFTGLDAGFQINRRSSIFALFNRIFGGATKNENPVLDRATPTSQDVEAQRMAYNPQFGSNSRRNQVPIPDTRGGWNTSLTFSLSRSRPVNGATVIDPLQQCYALTIPVQREACLIEAQTQTIDSLPQSSAGRQIFVSPPRAALNASTSFNLTQKWAAQWTSGYSFEEPKGFTSQMVSLRRELHDWDLVFSFTKTPYGTFAFTAFISLRAQPDLKFDYRRTDTSR